MVGKNPKATIVQFSDDTQTLPDGSKVIYAENDAKIVLYHKIPFEKGISYVYEKQSSKIYINNKPGTNTDKRKMIRLGTYFLQNADEENLVTLDVFTENK